jgi:hypothetical protein
MAGISPPAIAAATNADGLGSIECYDPRHRYAAILGYEMTQGALTRHGSFWDCKFLSADELSAMRITSLCGTTNDLEG